MNKQVILAIGIVLCAIGAGLIATQAINHNSDSSTATDGLTSDEINSKLNTYASKLNSNGGTIYLSSGGHWSVDAGGKAFSVDGTDLVYTINSATYYMPYHAIERVTILK